jgi:hypothetical protein
MKRAPKIEVSADKLVTVTEDHGGYHGGECLICGECGWIVEQPFGIPYNGDKELNALRHKKSCPVGAQLDKQGKWK